MTKRFDVWLWARSAALLFALWLCAALPGALHAQSLEERLATQPERFSRDQLVGRWLQVAHRQGDEAFRASARAHIFLVTPDRARPDEIELHSDDRKWITEASSAPQDGVFSAEFDYYPKADEISSAVPAQIHEALEGVLKWTVKLSVHNTGVSPLLKLTFFPGEVRWEYDRISGEITSHQVVGPGEPRELLFTPDPVVGIARSPTQRIEVLSFLGAEAPRPQGLARQLGATVTPQVLTTLPGQKLYPQAYLDETLAERRGRRIPLTITGDESGETVSLTLESRGALLDGEMRYGIALSRSSHPLGRPMTLSPSCGANNPYLYPPFLSYQWVSEFFATSELAATRDKGDCVPFDGLSGETVSFSIGEDVFFRVQWFANWTDLALAQYWAKARKLDLILSQSSKAGTAARQRMLGRFQQFMLSDALSAQQKIAIGAVYFGNTTGEGFATAITGYSPRQAQEFLKFRRDNGLGSLQQGAYFGYSGTYYTQALGRQGRDLARQVMAQERQETPLVTLERLALDEAIMVASARQLDGIFQAFTTDGLRAMVNLFSSINLGGKVFSMISGLDAYGNEMADEAYWLNIVDIAAEFTMFGATLYDATSPLRYYNSGTNGKIARLTDGLGDGRGQAFKARMAGGRQGGRLGNVRHFTARDPSGLSQVVDAFETLAEGFPASLSAAQRPQIVVNAAPQVGRLLPLPQTPIVRVRPVAPRAVRRPTRVVAPADPVTEFGHTARVAHQAPAQFRASAPDASDVVAGNFVLFRQTGRRLTEAQGRGQLAVAVESLSDGRSAIAPGALAFGRTEPVPDPLFAHRMELQGIEVAHFTPETVNMATTRAAVDGGWTVEMRLQPTGGPKRRVYVTKVEDDTWGLSAKVEFFDPTRGQVVRMDADDFTALAVVDAENPVTTYRARNPSQDGRRTTPVEFPAVQELPSAPDPVSLPASVAPQPNSYLKIQTAAGEEVIALGDEVGAGAINGVYRAAGRDGQVVRVSLDTAGNSNQVLNDWWARSFLADEAIDPDVIAPINLYNRRLIAEGVDQLQVIELVDEFSGTLANTLVKRQGGEMTQGQAAAYVAAAREINKNGAIWIDGHLNNFTFLQTGEDSWKVQIFDPGGIYPIKGETASARAALARQIQTEAWLPDEVYQNAFAGNRQKTLQGFRADIVTRHIGGVDVDLMQIPDAKFALFDPDLPLAANLEVPFEQTRVRALIKATR